MSKAKAPRRPKLVVVEPNPLTQPDVLKYFIDTLIVPVLLEQWLREEREGLHTGQAPTAPDKTGAGRGSKKRRIGKSGQR